jgi:hypothetical protein
MSSSVSERYVVVGRSGTIPAAVASIVATAAAVTAAAAAAAAVVALGADERHTVSDHLGAVSLLARVRLPG